MSRHDIIFVTNHNDFHHQDRFDGIDYNFPPGELAQCPVDAASHMFGFNKPDKTETLVRLGWAIRWNPETKRHEDDPNGVKKLAKFVFSKAKMVQETVEQNQVAVSDPDDLEIA